MAAKWAMQGRVQMVEKQQGNSSEEKAGLIEMLILEGIRLTVAKIVSKEIPLPPPLTPMGGASSSSG